MEFEIECEPLELGTGIEGYVIAAPPGAVPYSFNSGRERSNWQQVANGGSLCRRRQWRWCERFQASSLRLSGARQWRRK